MSETTRIDRTRTTLLLALVDIALILLFVVLGEIRHNVDPLAQPARVLSTFTPFLVGWLAVAVLAGVYTRGVRFDARTAAVRTAAAWVLAALVGQALRATAYFHGDADPAFVAVSILVGVVLLVPWRVAVARFQLLD